METPIRNKIDLAEAFMSTLEADFFILIAVKEIKLDDCTAFRFNISNTRMPMDDLILILERAVKMAKEKK